MEPDIESLAAYDWYHKNIISHVVLTSDVFQFFKEIGVKFLEPKLITDVEPDYDDNFRIKKVVDPSARRVWLARGPTKTQLESAGWKFTLEPRRCHNILVKVLEGPWLPYIAVTGSIYHTLKNLPSSPYQLTLGPVKGLPVDETYHYIPLTLNKLRERIGLQCEIDFVSVRTDHILVTRVTVGKRIDHHSKDT